MLAGLEAYMENQKEMQSGPSPWRRGLRMRARSPGVRGDEASFCLLPTWRSCRVPHGSKATRAEETNVWVA